MREKSRRELRFLLTRCLRVQIACAAHDTATDSRHSDSRDDRGDVQQQGRTVHGPQAGRDGGAGRRTFRPGAGQGSFAPRGRLGIGECDAAAGRRSPAAASCRQGQDGDHDGATRYGIRAPPPSHDPTCMYPVRPRPRGGPASHGTRKEILTVTDTPETPKAQAMAMATTRRSAKKPATARGRVAAKKPAARKAAAPKKAAAKKPAAKKATTARKPAARFGAAFFAAA
ncbi:hypothetical protein, partial [Paracraurococcus ruber]